MPYGPDLPVPMTVNPILGAVFGGPDLGDMSEEMEHYRERERERELRLLGTMLFQALMLALCILLYAQWKWSHFQNSYESAIFYGFAGFSVQAGFYFIYRAMFEDSSSHRRQLKKMRQGNRRKMAQMKFQVEKSQQEIMLQQQMTNFQTMVTASVANDGFIDANEDIALQAQLGKIQALIQEMKIPQQTQQPRMATGELDPKAMGMDRHRVMGIPVGPSLIPNFDPHPVASTPTIPQASVSSVPSTNLKPAGADEILHPE